MDQKMKDLIIVGRLFSSALIAISIIFGTGLPLWYRVIVVMWGCVCSFFMAMEFDKAEDESFSLSGVVSFVISMVIYFGYAWFGYLWFPIKIFLLISFLTDTIYPVYLIVFRGKTMVDLIYEGKDGRDGDGEDILEGRDETHRLSGVDFDGDTVMVCPEEGKEDGEVLEWTDCDGDCRNCDRNEYDEGSAIFFKPSFTLLDHLRSNGNELEDKEYGFSGVDGMINWIDHIDDGYRHIIMSLGPVSFDDYTHAVYRPASELFDMVIVGYFRKGDKEVR